jgi:hypothetical protein
LPLPSCKANNQELESKNGAISMRATTINERFITKPPQKVVKEEKHLPDLNKKAKEKFPNELQLIRFLIVGYTHSIVNLYENN